MRKLAFAVLFLALLYVPLGADPDFTQILTAIDQMGNFEDSDFYCEYTLTSQKPGEPLSVTRGQMFRRDRTEARPASGW